MNDLIVRHPGVWHTHALFWDRLLLHYVIDTIRGALPVFYRLYFFSAETKAKVFDCFSSIKLSHFRRHFADGFEFLKPYLTSL